MASLPNLNHWGLRLKILASSFVPTMLALVAVGLVSFFAFQTTTRSLLIERNRELVRVLATQLAGEMESYPGILEEVVSRLSFTGGAESQAEALLAARNSLVVFDGGVIVTDPYGVVVAAEPENSGIIGQNWSERSYFRSTLRSMQPTFSDVVSDGITPGRGVIITVPLVGPQNEFRGIIAGMFRLDALGASIFYGDIVKMRIGESEAAHINTYLVDGAGRVIYHSDSSQIGADFSGQPVVQNILSGNFTDQFSTEETRQISFRGSAGAMRTVNAGGTDIVAYYASIPGTSWGLVSESSWDGLLNYYQPYLFLQSTLFVLGVIVPALLVNDRIGRIIEPIYQLKKGAEEVASGSYGRQVEVDTGDELEELGASFNHMSAQLAQSYTALREREERLALVLQASNDGIWDWNVLTNEVYFSPRWKSMLGYAENEVGGYFEDWLKLIHPDDVSRATLAIRTHLELGGEGPPWNLEHRLRHKDGSYRWVLARGLLLDDELGRPVRMVGSNSDVTLRRKAEEDLRQAYETMEEQVAQRTRHLAALNTISALVNRSLDIRQTFANALYKVIEITGMELGAAYRLEGERAGEWLDPAEAASESLDHLHLNPLVYQNLPEELVQSLGRLPFAGSGIEGFLKSDQPLIQNIQPSLAPNRPDVFLRIGVKQIVSVPLTAKGRLMGVIRVGSTDPQSFSREEINLLAAIGQQVGVAVENARLHEAVQRTATLDERSRLARELHDSVTQSLYSVTLLAEAATRLLNTGDTQTAAEHLHELREAAQDSLREMRLLIYELRPAALEKSGLAEALRQRLDAVESRAGVKTTFTVEGIENITYLVKTELYQIAQEALNNVIKHSHASQVQVRLTFSGTGTRLEIEDNGAGFDPAAASQSGGMGLHSLAERAQKLGGRLQIVSAPHQGTRICVEVGYLA